MLVTIKNKSYNFEFGSVWGPLYTYEELFGEKLPFSANRTLCIHLMLYCILVRCNSDLDLVLDEFLESLNDMKLEHELREYYIRRMEVLTSCVSPEDTEENKKKD